MEEKWLLKADLCDDNEERIDEDAPPLAKKPRPSYGFNWKFQMEWIV